MFQSYYFGYFYFILYKESVRVMPDYLLKEIVWLWACRNVPTDDDVAPGSSFLLPAWWKIAEIPGGPTPSWPLGRVVTTGSLRSFAQLSPPHEHSSRVTYIPSPALNVEERVRWRSREHWGLVRRQVGAALCKRSSSDTLERSVNVTHQESRWEQSSSTSTLLRENRVGLGTLGSEVRGKAWRHQPSMAGYERWQPTILSSETVSVGKFQNQRYKLWRRVLKMERKSLNMQKLQSSEQ